MNILIYRPTFILAFPKLQHSNTPLLRFFYCFYLVDKFDPIVVVFSLVVAL